jgi:hypothetical protein
MERGTVRMELGMVMDTERGTARDTERGKERGTERDTVYMVTDTVHTVRDTVVNTVYKEVVVDKVLYKV